MSDNSAISPEKSAAPPYVSKRGRPTASQAEAIGDHILLTARNLFLSDGFAATTMEAVAAAAGISKGTLYARYPGKSQLFHALVVDRLEEWSRRAPTWTRQPDESLFEYLYHRGSAMLAAMSDPEISAFTHLVNSESRQFPELAVDFRIHAYERLIVEIAGEIERFAREGGWPMTDAKSVATVFVNALMGWWQSQIQSNLKEIPKAAADQYTARLVALLTGGRAAF